MAKRHTKSRNRQGLQAVTLCISTAMVLVLLGLVIFSVLVARNTSEFVKENLVVTVMFEQDMTTPEGSQLCARLKARPYINHLDFISKERALKEQTKVLGTDPTEFTNGENPYLPSADITLKADYANNDSLRWIAAELKKYPKVSDITYQKDLVESVNRNLAKVSIVLLVIASLLTFVSFSLISNTVRLGVYARRFSIHTMKLVGASWGFIRRPFLGQAALIGVIAALMACAVLGSGIYAVYYYAPDMMAVITWQVIAITAATVLLFGILITVFSATISVNKFLKMKAGDLYKI